jgi:UDP-N-acetylmuramoyl-tripeptide--D-alanyl-D-alanine ligase
MNALGALTVIKALHGSVATIIPVLEKLTPVEGRGVRHLIILANGTEATLIDEAYNANPASMLAAFSVLELAQPQGKGRRIAVLGDMLELGTQAPGFHAELAAGLQQHKTDLVFCCGPLMRHLYDALPAALRGGYAADSAALAPIVAAAISAGDVILLKSSKGSKVSLIVTDLLRRYAKTGQKHAV